jgi:hypothetical protein
MWKSHIMSRSMTQINIYVKIPHNVKVNHSNQYLYENPIQCQGQWLKSIFIWKSHTMSRSMTQINIYMKIMHNVKVNDSNQYVYENHAQCQGQWLKSIFIWKSCTMSRSMPYQYLCACYILCLCVYCNSIFKYMKQQVSSCMPLKSVLYE